MPTILNKFEFEFYFVNCLQGIAILHRTRSSYRQQKRRSQQAVSSNSEELSNGHLQTFHGALMKSDQVTVF